MARRKNTGKLAQDTHAETKINEARLLRHIGRLNLRTKEAYKGWCAQHGFSTSFAKTDLQRQHELKKHADILSRQRLKQHSSESKLRHQILKISGGEVCASALGSDVLLEIAAGFKKCRTPDLLLETLLYLERRSKLISSPQHIRGIVALVAHHASWQRPLNQWRAQKHNARRQFASLIRHLVARYDVPSFMDGAWLSGKKKHQNWFIHIGAGHNIRTAEALPISLTRKMAHHYLQAPERYTVLTAFRWAQVQSLGGDIGLCDSIVETQLGRRFKEDEFWMGVMRFFIENPMLDRAQVHPIVDYIWNEKYVDQHEYDAHGRLHNTGPAQPNFTMRGRTGDSLLAQVETWHRRLGRATAQAGDSRWPRWMIGDYKFVEGNSTSGNSRVWHIRELLSSKELVAEGRQQKHCVASYAASCVSGASSIFTMDMRDCEGERKLLTIEVGRKHRVLYQVRGKRNRLPTNAEALVLRRWTQENGLKWSDG